MTESGQHSLISATSSTTSHAAWDTPSWLLTPATGGGVSLPVQTLNQLLPLSELVWEDFERLCLRLLRTEVGAVRAALYGLPGQAQRGIDVYAISQATSDDTVGSRHYVTLQSRRISNVTPANLESSVDDFLKGTWANVSKTFVYATSSSARSTQVLDKVEALSKGLNERSIAFEVWDQEAISEKLKGYPELVHDFFGRPWVKAFCGDEAASKLGNRLDAQEMSELRKELAGVYTTTFGLADPGYAGVGLNEVRRVELLERFVTPDLVSATRQTASYPYSVAVESEAARRGPTTPGHIGMAEERNARLPDEQGWIEPSTFDQTLVAHPAVAVDRRPADHWIGTEHLQVVIGDPGAGKSTLLRYLVLDLLRDGPRWKTVAEQWGECLPVWLPFHFFAQRVVGHTGEAASVGLALKAWLEQNESVQLWPLVEKALEDSRLLLVVDGLDEWTADDAGHYAARAIERFAAIRGTPVVASTRPYGLTKLTLDAGWVYSRIAPLTYDQQRSLVTHYFRAVASNDMSTHSAEIVGSSVDEFLAQVNIVPELRGFSGTPLFLILLVMLRLSSSSSLPVERFDVYDRAVQLLVADLPFRRRTAADITTARQGLPDHELRAILRRVSFVNQLRGNVSTLEEEPLREDFIDALEDPAHMSMSRENAVTTANQLMDVAEGELGLLVRVGPKQLAFIHRVMQEQLAAEYVANRLEFGEVQELFGKYVSNPGWKEVLLITFRMISRPSELNGLLTTIRDRVDETPTGLCAREFLAHIAFGSYGLPADAVQANAAEIIDIVETHAYGPHRARLLDAVLTGVTGTLTGAIVRECLERWTLLVYKSSADLVSRIGQIPPTTGLSEVVCELLVFGLRNADRYSAYNIASTIALRRSTLGSDEEGRYLRSALMEVLADPPSGLTQAAALAALALGWREDLSVAAILDEARSHPDDQVRLVAISDALNVLADAFPHITNISRPDAQVPTDSEKEWLIEYLWTLETPEVHFGMLVAAISAIVRDDRSVLADLLELHSSDAVPYWGSEVTRTVMLGAFADDYEVAEWVCDHISTERKTGLIIQIEGGDGSVLARAYHKGSPHNVRVAESIEHFLSSTNATTMDTALPSLAAVDQGPIMRDTLLKALANSSNPHWAARALAEHFSGDADALDELRSMFMDEPGRSSKIANAAYSVLGPEEVISRLLDILRSLAESPSPAGQRYDIVASALIRAYRELSASDQQDNKHPMREAIDLIPNSLPWIYGNPRLALAAELYPGAGSVEVLNEIADSGDPPLEVFLHLFREDAEKLKPLLAEASKILRTLPAYLRAHICRSFAERGIEPSLVNELTSRWADESSDPNKSAASLAYHQALVRVHEDLGNIESWHSALKHLGEQASSYGFDYHARRRAAWVGMCVLKDWSPALDSTETAGNLVPINVDLDDPLSGPDRILLQQIAASWEQLRSTFGDQLFVRFSSRLEKGSTDLVWNSLALVAAENSTLELELEHELAANPGLRTQSGVFLWTVRRRTRRSDVVLEDLTSLLRDGFFPYDQPIYELLAQPERIGLQPEQLKDALEQAAQGRHWELALELLAMLFSDHPDVKNAWRDLSESREASDNPASYRVNTQTYFAVAYAVSDSDTIVAQIQQHYDRLCKIGNPYVDRVFARHVSHRLRRDPSGADKVREAILNPDTPDAQASVLVSLLSNAVGLDDELLAEIERRISLQAGRRLATVVRDPHAGSRLPVRTILVSVAEGGRDQRSG